MIQSLLMVRQLYPTLGKVTRDNEDLSQVLFEKLSKILAVPDWKCRKLAAEAISSINSKHPISVVEDFFKTFPQFQNHSHGVLLATFEVLKKSEEKIEIPGGISEKTFLHLHHQSKELFCNIINKHGSEDAQNKLSEWTLLYIKSCSNSNKLIGKEMVLFILQHKGAQVLRSVRLSEQFVDIFYEKHEHCVITEKEELNVRFELFP